MEGYIGIGEVSHRRGSLSDIRDLDPVFVDITAHSHWDIIIRLLTLGRVYLEFWSLKLLFLLQIFFFKNDLQLRPFICLLVEIIAILSVQVSLALSLWKLVLFVRSSQVLPCCSVLVIGVYSSWDFSGLFEFSHPEHDRRFSITLLRPLLIIAVRQHILFLQLRDSFLNCSRIFADKEFWYSLPLVRISFIKRH